MSLIPFPNVPNVPGVPQVLRRLPAGPPASLGIAVAAASLVRSFLSKPQWGIYKKVDQPTQQTTTADGNTLDEVVVVAKRKPVVIPDNIVDFGYDKEWSITSAPTQNGAFVDYNRVAQPFEIQLRMTKGGTDKEQAEFLKQIDDLDSTQLYDILTPSKTYYDVNFLRIGNKRQGASGAYWMPSVDLYFREIRVVTSQYLNTTITQPKDTSAANVQNNGTQQAVTPANPPTPTPQEHTIGATGRW